MISEADVEAWSPEECRQVFGWLMRRVQKPQRRGKWVVLLADMKVGDTVLAPGLRADANLCTAKHAARQRLDAPEAQWKTKKTNHGIRILRTQ